MNNDFCDAVQGLLLTLMVIGSLCLTILVISFTIRTIKKNHP